jgi:hypothetical protein
MNFYEKRTVFCSFLLKTPVVTFYINHIAFFEAFLS